MKKREVKFPISTTLTLLDAYGNPRFSTEVLEKEPVLIPVPFKREVYKDSEGKLYYIYEGKGILEDTDIAIAYFTLTQEMIDGFDRFLICNECEDTDRELYRGIYKVLDLNMQKQDYIIHPQIQALQEAIIKKAGVKSA
ncbi:hypothetical protein BKH42_04110 [Helicobacter sp. 13S00482-2]|uniref:hypothetical protein n=1 Tax=Helicobacter sp. 13S00482-2 TaxID=1476200 RepID=UPI000BA5A00F|nr:hypothetical protein [Helicobacter sp. 13S00482-2]PAF53689.1 hypothetical protein BKH42_04110 [Helicobacter sp. 13S00482-2]